MAPSEFLQVFVTIDDKEKAQQLCSTIVEKKLAACAQILGPIESTYWWEGKVEGSTEWLCLMKSSLDKYETLERTIISLHPYDTPEVIAIPILKGSEKYLQWLGSILG